MSMRRYRSEVILSSTSVLQASKWIIRQPRKPTGAGFLLTTIYLYIKKRYISSMIRSSSSDSCAFWSDCASDPVGPSIWRVPTDSLTSSSKDFGTVEGSSPWISRTRRSICSEIYVCKNGVSIEWNRGRSKCRRRSEQYILCRLSLLHVLPE